jgi:cytochrome c oxidase subunit 4
MPHDTPRQTDPPIENEGLMPNLENEREAYEHDGHHVHVTPFWPMVIVFGCLLVLTALTLWTAKAEYFYVSNSVNLTVALIIASTKGLLVAAFFMHLIYDKALNTVIVVSTMFAAVLFITITLIDLGTQDMVDPTEMGEITRGGSVQINTNPVTGRTTIDRGPYSPFWSDNPGRSIVDLAREDPENTRKREKKHAAYQDADAPN